MKISIVNAALTLCLSCIFLAACSKNDTQFYDDAEDEGLAIFSNTGNNILSCFIAGKPWRTVSRTSSLFSMGINYEVDIEKLTTGSTVDTLIMNWRGYYQGSTLNEGYVSLHIAVPNNFSYSDLSLLSGKRLSINAATGYYSISISGTNPGSAKGLGSIYFQTAKFDSIGIGQYSGKMSGLFEADFSSFKITRGRFDHIVTPEQIRL